MSHPADVRWAALTEQIGQRLKNRSVDASRALVLVPYAQLMDAGRRAWAQAHPSGFSPRFESSRNWAATLQPFMPSANDLSGDMARDSLVAASLIDRVGRGRVDSALRPVLVARLVEAARQLAPLAAARPPEARASWANGMREAMATGGQTLQWEALVASLALAWTATSAYATDVLWSPLAAPGAAFDEVFVLQGFQPDPLTAALAALWGDRVTVLPLHEPSADLPTASLHACHDAQDEAQRAAACVIAEANAGRKPVALVANDRLLVRQVSAQLHGAGLSVRDETGWKLSTTHAAARLMSLLRAADPRARTDDLLDFLQQTRVWPGAQLQSLERRARALGLAHAASALRHPQLVGSVPSGLPELIAALQAPRPLSQWLPDLAQTLRGCGWWDEWGADAAGQQIVQTLRLSDGASHELAVLEQGLQEDATEAPRRRPPRMSLATFTAWVRDALEGASFMAPQAGAPDVVILPMAQLLGRSFAATVVPGCDERHLPASPEPPGAWTPQERLALGLPEREVLAEAARQAWEMLVRLPEVHLLWRTQEQGEAVLPSPWVLMLDGAQDGAAPAAVDPRERRPLVPEAVVRPGPSAGDLLPEALSASAYQDLRDCPYRFFALRQLRLQDADELEVEPDKRDMGIWLHAVLKVFHEERVQAEGAALDARSDREHIDRVALSTAEHMGLNALSAADDTTEGRAGFLPFQAAWPAVRDGYLDWLWKFEATGERAGPRFAQAELSLRSEAGPYRLIGTLDRVDHQDSPEGVIPFVIDYKTEPRDTTRNRVKAPLEDTQIAYYAALLPEETVRAAYLSVTESRDANATQLVEQTQVIAARDALREGLVRDLDRVAAGHSMPALGEGKVCDFCAARGLCRKDFWTKQ